MEQSPAPGTGHPPTISIVAPFYNESLVAPLFIESLAEMMASTPSVNFECVFVDDGSKDNTFEILTQARLPVRPVIVRLARNFGHQAAMRAGLDFATGDFVVFMDSDLQDPPDQIPVMLEALHAKQRDIVYSVRKSRKENWFTRTSFKAFYKTLSFFSETKIPENVGDFSIISQRVANYLRSSREVHPFLRGLRAYSGFSSCEIELDRPARAAGAPALTFRKKLKLACDGIFGFSTAPLRIAGFAGLVAIILSGSFLLYSVYIRLYMGEGPIGFAALLSVVVFCSGVQLLSLAIIGIYVGRIFEQVKQRPLYVVDEVIRS